MSSKQQKLRRMEKPGLKYGHFAASQMNAKPFSIRHYALVSRQQNIAKSWPFSQKYLKLCLNNGINNILPPLETPTTPSDGLHGRLVIDRSLDGKRNNGFGKICGTKQDGTEKISKPGEDASLEDTILLLCVKLGRLSLSYNSDALVRHKRRFVAKLDNQISGNVQGSEARDTSHKNTFDKGRRRKGRTKTKSLVEILAVAKRCILDGNDRILVSQVQNADEQRRRKVKGVSSGLNSRSADTDEGFSLMKKHQRSDDSVAGVGRQCSKRSRRTMGTIDFENEGCKLKSWSREMSSCTTAETEKKPGGFERKGHASSISVVELQDHNAC